MSLVCDLNVDAMENGGGQRASVQLEKDSISDLTIEEADTCYRKRAKSTIKSNIVNRS